MWKISDYFGLRLTRHFSFSDQKFPCEFSVQKNCKTAIVHICLLQSDSGFVTVFSSFFPVLAFFVVSRPQHAQPVFVICFCWLFTWFFLNEERNISQPQCLFSLVKADRTEKEWKHECNESSSSEPNIKCDELNAFRGHRKQIESLELLIELFKILHRNHTGNFHISVRLFYSFAHTSSRELNNFTHILRLSHQHKSLYGYFHFIIIHRYKYFSIKRTKTHKTLFLCVEGSCGVLIWFNSTLRYFQ